MLKNMVADSDHLDTVSDSTFDLQTATNLDRNVCGSKSQLYLIGTYHWFCRCWHRSITKINKYFECVCVGFPFSQGKKILGSSFNKTKFSRHGIRVDRIRIFDEISCSRKSEQRNSSWLCRWWSIRLTCWPNCRSSSYCPRRKASRPSSRACSPLYSGTSSGSLMSSTGRK